MPVDDREMHQQLTKYAAALKSFANSTSSFRIFHSSLSASSPPPHTLYVFDSSFNPPTIAHLRIATSALLHDSKSLITPKRLLLLLATQNADKAPQPASFEHRLTMMQIFASDLLTSISKQEGSEGIGIDIGVTKLPYFIDKAKAIEESGSYPIPIPQVHMTGFDTLIRIMDPKYYEPEKSLKVLEPFFKNNRLRVTYRTDADWGTQESQDQYLADIRDGKRASEGGKTEWVTEGHIEMCEGRQEGEEVISSTKVRNAAAEGNKEILGQLVTDGVADWILTNHLYTDA